MSLRVSTVFALLASAASLAQEPPAEAPFPPEDRWRVLLCEDDKAMTDAFRDEPNAQNDRDLIGDLDAATGWRSADAEFLYLRVRLDDDPIPDGSVQPFSWGVLVDTDGDLTSYEVLFMVNGIAEVLSAYLNTDVTLPNDPADPPDEPAVHSYELTGRVRSVVAPGSTFGDDEDFFLELALPWQDVADLGITPSTPIVTWAATASSSTSLNGDLACFDDATGGGDGDLDASGSRRTVFDPFVDSDGDGFTDATEVADGTDPSDAGSRPEGTPDASFLAGGGGCRSTPASPVAIALLLLLLGRRHQKRSAR